MTKKELQKDLETLGFSKNVSKVYLTLVELGETKAGVIVKKTGLHRHLVYTALDELEEKKLATRIQKSGVARFIPLNAEYLLSEVKRKEKLAESVIERVKLLNQTQVTQQVIIHESKKELIAAEEQLYERMLSGETQYILGLSPKWFELMGSEKVEKLAQIQREKKFYIKGIGNSVTEEEKKYLVSTPELTEFKMLSDIGSNDTEINILSDRILIKVYVEPFTSVEIINTKLAQDYKKYFLSLWNQESYVLTGAEAVRDLWLESLAVGELNFIAARGYFVDKYPELFTDITNRAQNMSDLRWRIINDPSTKGHPLTELSWVETRYVLPNIPNPNVVWIFGNKVAIANWTEDTPVIFVSTNTHLVQSYRDYFEAMWQQQELI